MDTKNADRLFGYLQTAVGETIRPSLSTATLPDPAAFFAKTTESRLRRVEVLQRPALVDLDDIVCRVYESDHQYVALESEKASLVEVLMPEGEWCDGVDPSSPVAFRPLLGRPALLMPVRLHGSQAKKEAA